MSAIKVKDSLICVTLTDSNVKKAVKSYTMSKRFINTMLKASVINILYHRLNIEENQFITKKFKEICYKSFKPKSKNIFIRDFHTYMLACKDAIDKNYLHEFFLFIIDTNSGDIIENYKFSFKYGEYEEPREPQTGESLIESTCELLRTLEELGKHEKLDVEIEIRVEFTYFHDTPEEYEPPGFRSVDESESLMKKMDKRGNSVIIGTLFTGFHMMKCRGKGDIFNFNITQSQTNEDCEGNEVSTEMEPLTEDTPQEIPVPENNDIMTEDFFDDPTKEKNNDPIKTLNDTYQSQCIDLSSDEEDPIDCPCKISPMDSFKIDDITCSSCKTRYHTACQGYLDNSYVKGSFRCCFCTGDENIFSPFDIKQALYIYRVRYVVGTLYKYATIPEDFKSLFKETLANLEKLKIFEFEGTVIKGVNATLLNNLFKSDYVYRPLDFGKFKNITL